MVYIRVTTNWALCFKYNNCFNFKYNNHDYNADGKFSQTDFYSYTILKKYSFVYVNDVYMTVVYGLSSQ